MRYLNLSALVRVAITLTIINIGLYLRFVAMHKEKKTVVKYFKNWFACSLLWYNFELNPVYIYRYMYSYLYAHLPLYLCVLHWLNFNRAHLMHIYIYNVFVKCVYYYLICKSIQCTEHRAHTHTHHTNHRT